MEFYGAERKKELLTLSTAWVELESIKPSEISQAVFYDFYTTRILFPDNKSLDQWSNFQATHQSDSKGSTATHVEVDHL